MWAAMNSADGDDVGGGNSSHDKSVNLIDVARTNVVVPAPIQRPMAADSIGGGSGMSTARLGNTTPRIGLGANKSSYSAATMSSMPNSVSIAGSTNMRGSTMASSVISSLTDGSTSVSGVSAALQGQGGAPKVTIIVGQRFLPDKRKTITAEFGRNNFGYANHFDKRLPKTDNPTEEQVMEWVAVLLSIHDNISNMLLDAILEHLQAVSREHNIVDESEKPGKSIVDIHYAALKRIDNECTEEYLRRALIFLKIPQKHDLDWVNQVKVQVKNQYDIRFPHSFETNFVQSIAGTLFNDEWNQRLRRSLWNGGSMIWYDRMPANINKNKIYQNTKVRVTRREFSIGENLIKGYLVEKVPGNAVAVELGKVASVTTSKEDYMKEAERLWDERGVSGLITSVF